MEFPRQSGILLHLTSLPGKYGIGTLGKAAFKFVDFLIESGQKLWQILPLSPTGFGDSPYQCFSAFAGNPLLINLEQLIDNQWISTDDIPADIVFDDNFVDYGKLFHFKFPILQKAYKGYIKKTTKVERKKFDNFCNTHKTWLNDYALFMAIKNENQGAAWTKWQPELATQQPEALAEMEKKLSEEIEIQKFMQYIFFCQWLEIKAYANKNEVKIVGDIPIYVSLDSADAWSAPKNFLFDDDNKPIAVAGVPPDFFSATGQLWGNPLFDWKKMRADGFVWWLQRIKANLLLYDVIRIDHFRGFAGFWSVPFESETAENGKWEKALGHDLFETVEKQLGKIPIIAEDLGVITEDVEALRDGFDFPGMKILQFAFGDTADNIFLPHNYIKNSVVYTGTHDNDTIISWFDNLPDEQQEHILAYLGAQKEDICWSMIRSAFASVSHTAIIPLQDILGLGANARMNTPSVAEGNWSWRFEEGQITKKHIKKLYELTKLYGR